MYNLSINKSNQQFIIPMEDPHTHPHAHFTGQPLFLFGLGDVFPLTKVPLRNTARWTVGLTNWSIGLMDKKSASRAGDSRFRVLGGSFLRATKERGTFGIDKSGALKNRASRAVKIRKEESGSKVHIHIIYYIVIYYTTYYTLL